MGKIIKYDINSTKEYNQEDEEMDMEEENNVKEEGTRKVLVHRKVESPAKRRRDNEMDADQDFGKGQETPLHA